MIARTHQETAVLAWAAVGPSLPAVDGPRDVIIGLVLAVAVASGPTSPDIDQLWSDGTAGLHHWRHHRGLTHRIWFAVTLSLLAGSATWGDPAWPGAAGLIVGWWSHLAGDMPFGRIVVLGRKVGLGLATGGAIERFTGAVLIPAALVAVIVWRAQAW